jgi:2-oxoglutarate ferredoxin oxidoreductase subunit beta
MTHTPKAKVRHPGLRTNALGLTRRDYEGAMSTLCAGCGHDSITAAIIEAFFDLDMPPHRAAKLSGIGCSSKTPTYFMGESHGFNSVHGRMPAIASGANAANRGLVYIGISGDGDSLSIGLGQMCHAIRRNVDMLYLIENNGMYALTKGQFSASADIGSQSKWGKSNVQTPIDPVLLALSIGATFVARSFSGDRKQLVPILKAGIRHPGLALVDIISPCVTFNDHEGSTKSYAYTRENKFEVVHTDFVPLTRAITADYESGDTQDVAMHDGSVVRFRKIARDYDPTDRTAVERYLRERGDRGEIVTGLLFIDRDSKDYHEIKGTVDEPLVQVPFERLNPGAAALEELQEKFR